jgi:hypothetical protein
VLAVLVTAAHSIGNLPNRGFTVKRSRPQQIPNIQLWSADRAQHLVLKQDLSGEKHQFGHHVSTRLKGTATVPGSRCILRHEGE